MGLHPSPPTSSTPSPSTRATGRVCVLGSLNMDLIVQTPRLPTPGETLLGGEFLTLPGGKGANQAVAAARAGGSVSLIGAVGDDDYGRRMVGVVGSEGVDTSGIRRRGAGSSPTGIAVITVATEQGENTIVVAGGANQTLTPAEIEDSPTKVRSAAVLLMQLESPVDAVLAAAQIAKHGEAGTTTILNAAPAQRLPTTLLERIDCLLVNRSEAAALTERPESSEPAELANATLDLGPRTVVLTLGSRGAMALARTGNSVITWYAPAFRVEPIDTVAAGDAFAGTLAAVLAAGRTGSLGEALTLASAAGALATTKRGAIPSLPSLAEINRLVMGQPECAARQE
ncbi:MAG: ribokinase [Phycisphaerales bacterium]|nr:ribokinase [Phycisphaerales bacterium]